MSDETARRPENGPRDAQGRFGPGNPGGGRPPLPDAFKAKGPDALMGIAALMDSEDEAVALKARQWVAERIYGKAPQALEDSDTREAFWAEMLERLRTTGKP